MTRLNPVPFLAALVLIAGAVGGCLLIPGAWWAGPAVVVVVLGWVRLEFWRHTPSLMRQYRKGRP